DALDVLDLGEVLARVDAKQRARRAVLLAAVGPRLGRALRIHRRVAAEVALDRDEVVGLLDRRRRRRLADAEPLRDLARVGLPLRAARDERDRVVRTLRRAVAAADARRRVDVDVAAGEAADRAGRAAGHALRVHAVHADRRVEQELGVRVLLLLG